MKQVIIVAGHAGSGKTEFSKQIADRTGWPLLDKDTLTRPFVESLADQLVGDPNDRHSITYLEDIRPLEYQTLLETMWEILEYGARGVVVTAPFVMELFDANWLENFDFDCDLKDSQLTVVWVHCDDETLKGRIIERGAARDRWKILNWAEWVASLGVPSLRETDVHVDNSVESIASLSSSVDALVSRLERA
ncbi:ATP-binding protein [Paeniglutamicibacter antarcticus]|uniref:ATP-binding protein n=1 Tax=Arthrobacter terrae TaxID=2935737 RepID=A0A931CPX6_9MICC|nr:AAA family ATPase [Arthrobacter terrae]MBG0738834.1 ATP-binding protein [Arthrobacter terrae]